MINVDEPLPFIQLDSCKMAEVIAAAYFKQQGSCKSQYS